MLELIKRNRHTIITWVGAFVVVGFMVRIGYNNIAKLPNLNYRIQYQLLAISGIILLLTVIYRAYIWRHLTHVINPETRLSRRKAFEIFTFSWISRYIPGNIGPIIGKAYFGKDTQKSQETLYLSGIMDTVIPIMAKFALAVFFIPALGVSGLYTGPMWVILYILFVLAGVTFMSSRWFYFLLNFLLRKIGREQIPQNNRLSYIDQLWFFFLYSTLHLLNAVGFAIFILSIIPQVNLFIFFIGVFLLSSALGVAAIFVPAGIGVTEGVMVAILQTQISLPLSILVAAGYRVYTILIDIILWNVAIMIQKAHKKEKYKY